MNYAIVENGIVTNVIWLNESNAHEFAGAVPIVDVSAGIGGTYADGIFFRDGQPLLTPLESAQATIAALDAALVDALFVNALSELGL